MSRNFIDLHMHSTASDGLFQPEEVMQKARAKGVGLISLTDHDTMRGVQRADAEAQKLGMTLIPGVEISTRTHGKNCHLLAYFKSAEGLDDFIVMLDERLEARERRFKEMVGKFEKIGVPLDESIVRRLADGAAITRPHVARALVEQGIVSEIQEAFDKYLADGKPCYVPYEKIETSDIIAQVREAGGITSVAHPGVDGFGERELSDLKKAGLTGIEVYHFDHDAQKRRMYASIATRLGLICTGGSDFHGHHARTFYDSDTEDEGVPQQVRGPFLEALEKAARSRA
ncbi:MAG: PHP domain-containing protein [Chrysiogenetes bacterium]|nr:PHP domain-containing protein [Chrysiogenetes bacterium]